MTETPRDDRGDLAAFALGRLDDVGFSARVEADPDLQRELAELQALVGLLSLVDVERLEAPAAAAAPPAHLERSVVDAVARDQAIARRRRWRNRFIAAGGAVAAAVLIVALILTWDRSDDTGPSGGFETTAQGADGWFAIEPRPWGTEIELEVAGLDRGEVYWLWLSDADGNRSGAGTFRGSARDQRLTLASALPLAEAARIWVTDEDDAVVLDSFLR